nr:hypothetical protein [Hyphomonas sp. Mor2]
MRWIIASVIALSPAAFAEDRAHLIAFSEGRYEDAAALAQETSTPDHLAFAARSLLAEAMSSPDFVPPQELLEEAESLAREALDSESNHIEGRLQLAIALSLQARPLSTREAMRSGYGEYAKTLVDSVLKDDPENPYAHGFLAVWHLEVRRRGGSIGASLLGASVKKARLHYESAIEISPGDASIHWQYARALAALNAKKYRAEIETSLQSAVDCKTDSTLEGVMRRRAELLQFTLQNEDQSVTELLALEML